MPIEVSFDTPWPLPDDASISGTSTAGGAATARLPLDSNSSRDAISTLVGDSTPFADPDLHSALPSLETSDSKLLQEFYPLKNAIPITVTHFWAGREETHQELLGNGLERPRWGNRRHKMFLQSSKIARDGRFTWIAGATHDLVWQMRVASATRNWMQEDFIEYSRLLESKKSWVEKNGVSISVPPVAVDTPPVEDITIETSKQPPTPSGGGEGGLEVRMDLEFIWHRDLMSRLAKYMRMSRHGAYLEPTVRLPLPQKDLGRYRQPLWVVFPFFNVDRGFQSRELNASQDLLSKITSYPDTFADPRSGYFPSLPPKLALKRSYDDSDLFPRRFKTPVVDGLPSMMMGRQSLYRFFLPDYEGEEIIENQQLSTLKEREQLMVDQWWILMPDENCVTTICTSEDQTNLHLSLRVRHPLLIALDIIRQYTQDSTNDIFDFDRVMEYYDGMILDIGLEQHREFSRLQVLQSIESKRIMQLNRILDEMKMISHVLAQQVVVVKKLGEAIDLFDWKTGRMVGTEPPNGNPVEPFENPRLGRLGYEDAGRILKEITNNIARHQEQVDGIVGSARSARDIEFQLLNLKQANTNFHESRVVTVFTVITIIFLPLSFLTGFFGMNVKEISGNSNTYTLRYFWLWAGTSCAVVVILALLVAFNRKTREMTGRAWEKFRRYRADLEKGPKEHLA